MSAIETDGLTKRYGDLTAFSDLSLTVESGSLFGLLGPNGSGKTTTIEILTGQTTPDAGTGHVLGIDPVANPREVRAAVGILPERELRAYCDAGNTLLLSTHFVDVAADLCDRVAILDDGRLRGTRETAAFDDEDLLYYAGLVLGPLALADAARALFRGGSLLEVGLLWVTLVFAFALGVTVSLALIAVATRSVFALLGAMVAGVVGVALATLAGPRWERHRR